MNVGSLLNRILPGQAGQPAPGLGTLAVQRQALVQNLAIKQQAQAEQAVAAMIAQAQQAGQSPANPPPRGSVVNILV